MAISNNKTHQKRMDKNCHIHDLAQAFSNVENGGKQSTFITSKILYQVILYFDRNLYECPIVTIQIN